jgi:hypothetical protein
VSFKPWGTLAPGQQAGATNGPGFVTVLPNNHVVLGAYQTLYVSKNLGRTFHSIATGAETNVLSATNSAYRYSGGYGLSAIWLPGSNGTALGKIAFSATNFNVPQLPVDGSSAWIKSA